jgi:DNA-binding response OmpR family regulator
MRILIVEDEKRLAGLLRRGMEEHGHAVDEAYDGYAALDLAETVPYDVIVLDVMLPGLDGLQVCRRLRDQRHPASILMLTARDAIEDRVAGLDCGADDYLVKPFAFQELVARVRALLRRNVPHRDWLLRAGDLELDPATREVKLGGQLVDLTGREYAILEYLLRNPKVVLSRDQIAEHVWGSEYEGNSNVIDVHIAYLRKKLGSEAAQQLLHTVRGVGYQLRPPAPAIVKE